MHSEIENTTLALQHYYDIKQRLRRHSLAYVYGAIEQPFGSACELWVLAPLASMGCDRAVVERMDGVFLGSRALGSGVCARVLDVGALSEQGSFVVTEPIAGVSLREHLRLYGAMEGWQALRVVEQLASLMIEAHAHDLRNLAISSDNIFVQDAQRMQIKTSPLGLGLRRSEILQSKAAIPSAEIARHIAPWEYAPTLLEAIKSEEGAPTEDVAAEGAPAGAIPADDGAAVLHDESACSVQDLSADAKADEVSSPFCVDFYALVSVAYECLAGVHPYFLDDKDLSDVVLSMREEKPQSLYDLGACGASLSELVMDSLLAPRCGGEASFVASFGGALTEAERQKAAQAAQIFSEAPALVARKVHRPRVVRSALAPGQIVLLVLLALLLVGVSFGVARCQKPVDLFALPELVPPSTDPAASDVVLVWQQPLDPQDTPPQLYLSTTDGELLLLGTLPYILKGQTPGSRLHFVITDSQSNSRQIPVLVEESANHLMVVEILP